MTSSNLGEKFTDVAKKIGDTQKKFGYVVGAGEAKTNVKKCAPKNRKCEKHITSPANGKS